MPTAETLLARDFATLPELLRAHAAEQPCKLAIAVEDEALDYAALDALADRIAAALQRDGVPPGEAVSVVAAPSLAYAALFVGALRAGAVPAPMPPSDRPGRRSAR